MSYRLLCFALLVLTIVGWSCSPETKTYTNVIFILTDDLGYGDLSCYGSTLNKTPNLDRMAQEGFKAVSFYAAQAVCSASRAAFLTGCYPNRIGIHNALMPKSPIALHKEEQTVAEILKDQGYATAMFGKWHLGDHPDFLPTAHGFDTFKGIPYSNDMWPYHPAQGTWFDFDPLPLIENTSVIDTLEDQSNLTKNLTNWSTAFIREHKDEPFFLYLAHPQPHVPLFVSSDFAGKSGKGLYSDVIMELDWSVGEIIRTLKETRQDHNTLVIFTSDNGPWLSYGDHAGNAGLLREGKGTSWEGGQREPFIAWLPGKIPPKSTTDEPFYAMDILPTIVEATGSNVLPQKKIDGNSCWKLITGQETKTPQATFYYYYATNELQAIRYEDWKMVLPHTYRTLNGRPGGTNGLPADYEYIQLEFPQLYNLKQDPEEKNNIYSENLAIVATIEQIAEEARRDLGDKLTGRSGENVRKPAETGY